MDGAIEVSPWLAAFIVTGGWLVVAYNLELLGGAFHSDLWFALAWGAFPALTGCFAQGGRLNAAGVMVAGACAAASFAQRTLSRSARKLRRSVRSVEGSLLLHNGTVETLDAQRLRAAPEGALRWLWIAMVLLATGLVTARVLR